jgi:hypothetical protein
VVAHAVVHERAQDVVVGRGRRLVIVGLTLVLELLEEGLQARAQPRKLDSTAAQYALARSSRRVFEHITVVQLGPWGCGCTWKLLRKRSVLTAVSIVPIGICAAQYQQAAVSAMRGCKCKRDTQTADRQRQRQSQRQRQRQRPRPRQNTDLHLGAVRSHYEVLVVLGSPRVPEVLVPHVVATPKLVERAPDATRRALWIRWLLTAVSAQGVQAWRTRKPRA